MMLLQMPSEQIFASRRPYELFAQTADISSAVLVLLVAIEGFPLRKTDPAMIAPERRENFVHRRNLAQCDRRSYGGMMNRRLEVG